MVGSALTSQGASLAAWRGRRKRRVWAVAGLALLGVLVLVAADRGGVFGPAGADRGRLEGRWAQVAEVRGGDGSGPVIELARGLEIGLLGVADAPGQAVAAAQAVRDWIGAGRVRVRFAPRATRDAAGRRVGYVENDEQGVLNERLLARGLARADHAAVHPQAERYALLAQQARDDAARAALEGR